MRKSMKVSREPLISPTVILYFGITTTFVTTLVLSFLHAEELSVLAWLGIFLLQSLMVFLAFTPMHESSHGIASRKRWVNEAVLLGCTPFFLADTSLFRLIHVTHHAKTNQGEEDPDHFTSAPTLGGRWLRSFLLVFNYYRFAWTKLKFRDRALYYRSFFSASGPILLLVAAILLGKLTWLLVAWGLPSFISSGILSFVNTAWPHDTENDPTRMGNTRIHQVPGWLQLLMCNQNLHLVHHLQPTLPWWKYPEVWEANREKWAAQGAKIHDYR